MLRDARVDDDIRDEAIAAWDDATEIMARRNTVAHNPSGVFKISRVDETSERGNGIVDVKSSAPDNLQYLDAEKINNLAHRALVAVNNLDDCRGRIAARLADSEGRGPE